MRTFFFLMYLLIRFIGWDLYTKLLKVISMRTARAWLEYRVNRWGAEIVRLARLLTGLRFSVENFSGSELPDQMIILANHQSLLDIVAILAACPHQNVRFVAKRSLGKWIPAVSEMLRTQRHALINRRGNLRQSMEQLRAFAEHTGEGITPVIFPEGTRSRDGLLRRFHPGAFRVIAEHSTIPIVSVAVDGGYRIASLADVRRGLSHVMYRVAFQRQYASPKGKTELNEVLQESRKDIALQLSRWRGKALKDVMEGPVS